MRKLLALAYCVSLIACKDEFQKAEAECPDSSDSNLETCLAVCARPGKLPNTGAPKFAAACHKALDAMEKHASSCDGKSAAPTCKKLCSRLKGPINAVTKEHAGDDVVVVLGNKLVDICGE